MLKRSIFLCLLIFGSFAIATSCGQENSDPLDQLTTRLVKDSNFIKLIEVENKRVLNLQNNTHGQKNVDWKLVQNEEERSNVKTKEDMIKLLEKAGMKDANTYLNLVDEYNFHMLKIKESYPELSMLKDSDRQSVINAARNQLLALNKN